MPNIKSAKKRVLVSEKANAANRATKSALKTELKKFEAARASGDEAKLVEAKSSAASKVDVTCRKGIIHKNKANRLKSRIAKTTV